ncbi:MBL fold metallo-hydrolase [Microbacterium sp. ZW T5_56]|uniref:MBL fold metallo-hydrolase n=1 Tax=Microbacterium sp. ZW T5_56 TaxID=3378081 RepID=UPI00385546A5
MEIAPGLHRVGDDVIAAYLMVDDAGVTVVDAGLPGYRRELRRELAAIGRTEHDIRAILLTHADADHVGFAEAVRADSGARVYSSAADVERATGRERAPKTRMPRAKLAPTLRFIWTGLTHAGRSRPIAEVTAVADGETLAVPGRPRAVAVPGHTPGSICWVSEDLDAVFVGDALTTRHVLTGHRGPQDAPFSEDESLARQSLDRLRGLAVRHVLPGHGPVWSGGVPSLLAEIQASRRAPTGGA